MPLISKAISGLYNGVSQQSPTMRLETQGEIQENGLSTLVNGQEKRPPTEHVCNLEQSGLSGAFVHKINRSSDERYLVFITGVAAEPIVVFTLDGLKCNVRPVGDAITDTKDVDGSVGTYGIYRNLWAFLTNSSPEDVFKALTISDYTFILRQNQVVSMESDLTSGSVSSTVGSFTDLPSSPGTGDIVKVAGDDTTDFDDFYVTWTGDEWDQTVKPGITYKINPTWMPHELIRVGTTGINNLLQNPYDNLSDWITGQGCSNTEIPLNGYLGSPALLADGGGSSPYVYKNFDVSAYQGQNLSVNFWRATGSTADQIYKLYAFDVTNGNAQVALLDDTAIGTVTDVHQWAEKSLTVPVPATCETLQLQIVRPGSGTFALYVNEFQFGKRNVADFEFDPIAWDEREIGDSTSCPVPSFINKRLTNLFFYKDRLGFLCEDNIILSRSGDYFNYWTQSALDVFDDDPIDVSASVRQVETLRSTIVFDESLLILSDQQQFDLGSGDASFTPQTVALTPTTNFEIIPEAEPVAAGANIYFGTPNGTYAAIREYFIQPDSLIDDASNITAHVPDYIPNDTLIMAVCNSLDILIVLSPTDNQSLYVYKYYWSGNEKPQSSWSKWTFDNQILNIKTIGTTLYLVMSCGGYISLETITLEKSLTSSMDFLVRLDRQIHVNGIYNSGTDKTTWTLPYHTAGEELTVVHKNTAMPVNGVTYDSVSDYESYYTVVGNESAKATVCGFAYTWKYRLSPWFLKDQQGTAITSGRLQARSITVSFDDTGYFRVEVTAKNRDTISNPYTGVLVGSSTIGTIEFTSGAFKTIVMAEAETTEIELINDTYFPSAIQSAIWEGYFHIRSRLV